MSTQSKVLDIIARNSASTVKPIMGHKLRKNHGISASGLTCLGFELEDQFSIEIPLETSSNWRSVKQVVATVEAILGQL